MWEWAHFLHQDISTETHPPCNFSSHTLHFLSSHAPFVPLILFFYGFCFAGCFWLTDSSWMSWLRQKQGPECVGWPLELLCMCKAHTALPHTFLIHAGDIPHSATFKSFSIDLLIYLQDNKLHFYH